MKLIPRFEFEASEFAEMMGNKYREVDADLFRYFLLDRGYRDTKHIGNNKWTILLEEWEEETKWVEPAQAKMR